VSADASPGMMAVAAKQVKKQPPLTASEFVSSYNATMTAKTGDEGLDPCYGRDENSFACNGGTLGQCGAFEVRVVRFAP